jgi:replicative DNA helicase
MDLNQCMQAQEEMLLSCDTRMFTPIPTGFKWLDQKLGGGLHSADIIILGGKQNLGKTAMALQWSVHIASTPEPRAFPIFICYEHMELELYYRILCLQSAITAERIGKDPFTVRDMEQAYLKTVALVKANPAKKIPVIDTMLSFLPKSGNAVIDDIGKYKSNMWLITGVPNYTTTDAIRTYLQMCWDQYKLPMVLFIDYIQRIPIPVQAGVILSPEQRVEYIIRDLDSIGKEFIIPVVGIAGADEKSLRQGRVHIENLFGTNALQYDPSVGVMLNFDHAENENLKYIRVSDEKNRRGPTDLECVIPYDGPHYRFLTDQAVDVPIEQSWQLERHGLREEIQNRQILQLLAEIVHPAGSTPDGSPSSTTG